MSKETYLDPSDRFWSKPVAIILVVLGITSLALALIVVVRPGSETSKSDRGLVALGCLLAAIVFFVRARVVAGFGFNSDASSIDNDT